MAELLTVAEAVATVRSGDLVALGGLLLENRPCELVRGLVRRRDEGLTISLTSSPAASWDVDLLIATGIATRVLLGHVSLGPVGLAPAFSSPDAGDLEVVLCDEAILIGGFLAAGERVATRAVGSVGVNDVTFGSELVSGLDGPGGAHVTAIAPDVTFLHAPYADRTGTLYYEGSRFADEIMARASRRVVAEVDELVDAPPPGATDAIPGYLIDAVIPCAGGGRPGGVAGRYRADWDHLRRYQRAVAGGGLEAYLDAEGLAGAGVGA